MLELIALVISALTAFAAYDEYFDGQARYRPAVREFIERHGAGVLHPTPGELDRFMNRPFNDHIRILPKPVILSDEEYLTLQKGALQRARALTHFFADLVGIARDRARLDSVMPMQQVWGLLGATPAYGIMSLPTYYRFASQADINFLYGADVIRAPDGRFFVMEDNLGGHVGGLGDVNALFAHFDRSLRRRVDLEPPFVDAVRAFLADLPQADWSRALVLDDDPKDSPTGINYDLEHERVIEQLKSLGLKVVKASDVANDPTLLEPSKLSHIINFSDPLALNMPSVMKSMMLGFFQGGKLKLFSPPGSEVITNKAFLPWVERMIRIYLGEKPILRTIPTVVANGFVRENSVYKRVDGSQGQQVYFTSRLTESERSRFKIYLKEMVEMTRLVSGAPAPRFVRQPFVDASYVPADGPGSWVRFNVDFRPLVAVIGGEPRPNPPIYGRSNFKFPGSVSNVSAGGFEVPVVTPNLCAGLLTAPFASPAPAPRDRAMSYLARWFERSLRR